jgi:hypothetical protein
MSELSSSLADRYDGLMLGFFTAAVAEPSTAERFSYLWGRINDYLADIAVPLELPKDRNWLIQEQDQLFKIIWHEISKHSIELGDFFFLGASACVTVTYPSHAPDEVAGLKTDMLQKLEKIGLNADVAHSFWARTSRPTTNIEFDDMVSAALWLARVCIEPLPEEPSSAFVSMPFAEPFATRYRQFYVPLLRAQGFRAFRAWGGVAFEDYWDLLVALIRKASGFLADVTGNNPNVLHEIGMAEGLGKTAMLVIEGTDALAPSNLGYHAVVSYFPNDPGWPKSSIQDAVTIWGAGHRAMLRRIAEDKEKPHRVLKSGP